MESSTPAVGDRDNGLLLQAPEGLALAVERHGPADAPCAVFAHGFGQTRGSWRATAGQLAAAGWCSVLFDARGHGDSGRSDSARYDLDALVEDLAEVVAAQPRPPVLVGASMGGLISMVAHAERPQMPCRALVLVDITPRWETAGVERILGFMQAHPDGFDSLEHAGDVIAAYLPQRSRGKRTSPLQALLREGADGRWRWHWDPAMLAAMAERHADYQPRLLEAASKVRVPTLLVSGADSDVVSDATVDEFRELVPHARHVELSGASHMLVGDDNDAFAAAVKEFLASLPDLGQEPAQRMRAIPT